MTRTRAKSSWALPAVLLLALGLIAGRSATVANPAGDSQSKLHEVEIKVDFETGRVWVEPDTLRVARGDRISFNSDAADWSVHFNRNTPFADANAEDMREIRGMRAGPTQLPVRGNVEDGIYVYFVNVYLQDRTESIDPVIIVGPGD